MADTILFGKYQLCRIIGKGRTGTVYQARHLSLGEYRAIKQVAKADVCGREFRREALLLKELRHPGIPIVYDLEEDKTHYYLIEEFLEGESISALVKRLGNLTGNMVIRYGIQICDLVHYLHSAGTEPILYLDLQPNNLLLCHGTIKLVDFGCAEYQSQANKTSIRYGTPGCAAPEQYTREPLDVRTDIYAIGVILFYLAAGYLPESGDRENRADLDMAIGRGLYAVIRDCMCSRELRIESALEVKKRLEKLFDSEPWIFQNDSLPSLILSFAGSGPNIGVTHLALGLSACLWKWGIPNLYEECNPSGHAMLIAESAGADPDDSGICRVGSWLIRPEYGPQVRFRRAAGYPVVIRDYGDIKKGSGRLKRNVRVEGSTCRQRMILVCGGKAYEIPENQKAEAMAADAATKAIMLCNFTEPGFRPARLERPFFCCMAAPYFRETGRPSKDAEAFFRELWSRLTDGKGVERYKNFSLKRQFYPMKGKP